MSGELYGGQDPIALAETYVLSPDDVTVVKDQSGRVVGYLVLDVAAHLALHDRHPAVTAAHLAFEHAASRRDADGPRDEHAQIHEEAPA